MLSKTKVFNGPFVLALLAGSIDKYTVSGLKKDAVVLSVEPQTEDLEDFTKDLYGYTVKAEISFSELDATDLETIQDETIDCAEIRFVAKGRKIVISNPTDIILSVDSLKTKISIEKFSPSAKITDAFTIQAIN